MNDTAVRWGIIATGWIAEKFAEACQFEAKRTGKSALLAVASRNEGKSREFAGKWGIPRAYGSYEALLADPEVTAVYIATPNHLHTQLSIRALQAGKAVLCEKPVSIAARDFYPVIKTAGDCGKFFMEAMWMKFNPSFRKMLSWIDEGRVGAVRHLRSDFFIDSPYNPEGRYYSKEFGGGALLDVGIYPVTCAVMVAGKRKPERMQARLKLADTGVDLYNKITMEWDSGLCADLSSAINLQGIEAFRSAALVGERGSILLPLFWMAQEAVLLDHEGNIAETFRAPFECNGYEYEIREVEACLDKGLTESPVQTWGDSIMVMELLDQIRESSIT